MSFIRPYQATAGEPTSAQTAREAVRTGTTWNVLLLVVDELHYQHFSFLGHPYVSTPNMDRVRAEGVYLPNVFSTHPLCAPARWSWYTSLWSTEHGVPVNGYVFDAAHYTHIADVFGAGGYTAYCYGKLHSEQAGEEDGTYTAGYDVAITEQNTMDFTTAKNALIADEELAAGPFDAAYFSTVEYEGTEEHDLWTTIEADTATGFEGRVRPNRYRQDDEVLTDLGLQFLRAPVGTPWLLKVGLRLPHYPFDLPETRHDATAGYFAFDPADVDTADLKLPNTGSAGWEQLADTFATLTDLHTRLLRARYMGAVQYADHLLGLLLDELDSEGLTESTLVVITTDHGDFAGHRGLWLKHGMYDDAVRTPILLRMPGALRPGTNELLFSGLDLFPTIAGLVNLPQHLRNTRGRDLSRVITGTSAQLARDVVLAFGHVNNGTLVPGSRMACDGRYKLIRYANGGSASWDNLDPELYDLLVDPDEQYNLAAEPSAADVLATLDAAIDAEVADFAAPLYPLVPA